MLFPFQNMFHPPHIRLRHFFINVCLPFLVIVTDAHRSNWFMVLRDIPFLELRFCHSSHGRLMLSFICRNMAFFKPSCPSSRNFMVSQTSPYLIHSQRKTKLCVYRICDLFIAVSVSKLSEKIQFPGSIIMNFQLLSSKNPNAVPVPEPYSCFIFSAFKARLPLSMICVATLQTASALLISSSRSSPFISSSERRSN